MEDLEWHLQRIETQSTWGTYHMGKYYFTINTNKSKTAFGITSKPWNLTPQIQNQLQRENYPALFHEYIHYIHEITTVIGNVGLMLDLTRKNIFSRNFSRDLKSCENTGITEDQRMYITKVIITQGVLMGSNKEVLNEGTFFEILNITYEQQPIWIPNDTDQQESQLQIPKIHFAYLKNGTIYKETLLLGKFFVYEGIAYELDREIDRQLKDIEAIIDHAKGSEYTILRMVAKYVFPDIEISTFLQLASLSLQYLNCGSTFISMVKKVKAEFDLGLNQQTSIRLIKEEVAELLLSKKNDFNEAFDEVESAFLNREQLSKAFSYLAAQAKALYQERISNPTFEIDLVLDGRHAELVEIVPICDYMYLFNDEDEFMRDFIGTSIDEETSQALKTLLSYDHMHSSHQTIYSTVYIEPRKQCKCPFYHCCDLPLRQDNEEICKTKPWRIFDISANSDQRYCWYGQAVGEFKGHTKLKVID